MSNNTVLVQARPESRPESSGRRRDFEISVSRFTEPSREKTGEILCRNFPACSIA